eukprot:CAMPEP_0176269802 /NCGR_PEP_ID=MMETSP0121_2-20121125/44375_1 /TAXON_ID=160619 /ORGANISM="Kryptoperidinium foliaceum, Strain CCMP 1326" /LENGTH=70 /DNA_ID=CAMNT_0017609933 /DNA_START=105 /DNA_END=317 /DNA_ORIENTATION=+
MATDNNTIFIAAGIAMLIVIVAAVLLNKFTNAVVKDDMEEEPRGSKWIKHAEAEDEDDSGAAKEGDKKDD